MSETERSYLRGFPEGVEGAEGRRGEAGGALDMRGEAGGALDPRLLSTSPPAGLAAMPVYASNLGIALHYKLHSVYYSSLHTVYITLPHTAHCQFYMVSLYIVNKFLDSSFFGCLAIDRLLSIMLNEQIVEEGKVCS